jgi:hypothetical protein
MVECPECGNEYKSLGCHWRWNSSHRPELTQRQLEITTGLLMGDGWIQNSNKNCSLETSMISLNYIKYLDEVFGCLSSNISLKKTAFESAKMNRKNGFSPNADEENYSDVYRWKTVDHPKFNEFRQWYSSGEKVWPDDIELTPTVLKHWYVGDGRFFNDSGHHSIRIKMNNEVENTKKVSQYFTNAGLPAPSNYSIYEGKYGKECEATWTVQDTEKLFDYMGKPLPDFEYKWPEECR